MPFWKYPFTTPVEVARNLIPNPSFESDTSGWVTGPGSPAISRVARAGGATAVAGEWNLRATATANATMEVMGPQLACNPGVTVTAIGSTRGTALASYLTLRFYNAADVLIGSAVLGASVINSSAWSDVFVTATAPALTAFVRVGLRTTSAAIGNITDWDTVGLFSSPTVLPYFDGNTPPSPPTYYRWLGAVNNSASVRETPGASDTLTPLVDVLTPYGMSRETRTVAQELMESSSVRVAWYAPGARSGELRIGFADTASAMAGMSWFSTNSTFFLDHSESYADMTFTVAGGEIRFERDEIVPVVLVVPFKELT